jgi:hypothetical protein
MDKRPAAAAEPLQRRDVQPERDFVLARASQEAPLRPLCPPREDSREHSCDSSGERSGKRFPAVALPPSWAARHSADADLDGEILAWIVSHVPSHKRLKTPH